MLGCDSLHIPLTSCLFRSSNLDLLAFSWMVLECSLLIGQPSANQSLCRWPHSEHLWEGLTEAGPRSRAPTHTFLFTVLSELVCLNSWHFRENFSVVSGTVSLFLPLKQPSQERAVKWPQVSACYMWWMQFRVTGLHKLSCFFLSFYLHLLTRSIFKAHSAMLVFDSWFKKGGIVCS